jgi:hypothetical protein
MEGMMFNTDDFDIPTLKEKMLAHLGEDAGAYPAQLEKRYPRILAKLVELWGTPQLDTYLDGLLVADRDDRQGFPDDVAGELFKLSMIHTQRRPAPSKPVTGWAGADAAADFDALDRRSSR